MLVHWIWLATRPKVSDWAKVHLLQHFQDPEDAYFAGAGAFDHIESLSAEGRESLEDKDLTHAEEILEACYGRHLQILTYQDAAYPRRLKNISDPPLVLYYQGQLPALDATAAIAVVGTRKASLYGLTTAKRMGYQIGKCGGIVVSGMASGIDAMAMEGALTSGAPVVGVLGCGADLVYPAENRALFRDTAAYGCILSEFPPGTPPAQWTFPKRNRIISGLSNGVLVVEAPKKSGALITAKLAAEQGRDVFAVPGKIDTPSSEGSNALLRSGATIISSGWDVVGEYASVYPDKLHMETAPAHQQAYPDEARVAQKPARPKKKSPVKEEFEPKAIDKAASGSYSDVDETRLTPDERAVVATLKAGERPADEIIAETGFTAGKFLSLLTTLELKGVIRRLPGKRIALK